MISTRTEEEGQQEEMWASDEYRKDDKLQIWTTPICLLFLSETEWERVASLRVTNYSETQLPELVSDLLLCMWDFFSTPQSHFRLQSLLVFQAFTTKYRMLLFRDLRRQTQMTSYICSAKSKHRQEAGKVSHLESMAPRDTTVSAPPRNSTLLQSWVAGPLLPLPAKPTSQMVSLHKIFKCW